MSISVLNYYLKLMEKDYYDLVVYLTLKYGFVVDNYFEEKSYRRFEKGIIKIIKKGNYTKTNEGLYCHHVYENKYKNLSNEEFIRIQNPGYEVHLAENLVYCNLVEHTILHYKIAMQTKKKYGYQGFSVFLIPQLKEWYIEKKKPKKEWMTKCYERSFLSKIDAIIIVTKMENDLKKHTSGKAITLQQTEERILKSFFKNIKIKRFKR